GVRSVAFAVDGTQLVSWGEDGTLRAWPAPATWQAHLCAKLTRDMSFEQWQTWLSPEIPFHAQCPKSGDTAVKP
ncbi:MAG TPA: WD40 repeat domain-containing protein, partial [Burkholderiaceae bacterium]|nr:WD40 repeat domain-containing protein [Burkholderiaceae bacterium]